MFASTFAQDYWSAALDYWRDPDAKSWIIVNPGAMGDTFCTLALLKGFKAQNGGPLTLVVKKSHADLMELFPDLADRLIVWEDERLVRFSLRIRGCGHFAIDEPIIAHPIWHGSSSMVFPLMELLRFEGRGGVSFLDQWRLMLRLPWTSPLDRGEIPNLWRAEAEEVAEATKIPKGRSVILFPDNNTNPRLPDAVWEGITKALIDQGLSVFTNLHGAREGRRMEPIKGSRGVEINLRTAGPLVEHAGRFVTMANGMQALLMGIQVKAEHTFLLTSEGMGESWGSMGFKVRDPLIQSFRCVGLAQGPFNEYLIAPDQFDDQLAQSIAHNSTSRLIVFERSS